MHLGVLKQQLHVMVFIFVMPCNVKEPSRC